MPQYKVLSSVPPAHKTGPCSVSEIYGQTKAVPDETQSKKTDGNWADKRGNARTLLNRNKQTFSNRLSIGRASTE